MNFNRASILAAFFLSSLGLASCGSNVDVKYPTVQQLDDMDVQWGLPRRESKGGPSRTYTYDPAVMPSPRRSSSGSVPAVPANDPAPPPPSASPSNPQIPDILR